MAFDPFQGYKEKGAYIATQGPLQNTIVDFWRMIWEFRCSCIVMLCELEEEGKVKSRSSPIAYDSEIRVPIVLSYIHSLPLCTLSK